MDDKLNEIYKNLGDSLNTWTDILLDIDLMVQDRNILPPKIDDATLMNITHVFVHILSNRGFHNKRLHNDNVLELADKIRSIILEYSELDTLEYYK